MSTRAPSLCLRSTCEEKVVHPLRLAPKECCCFLDGRVGRACRLLLNAPSVVLEAALDAGDNRLGNPIRELVEPKQDGGRGSGAVHH
jgi:hypothetical protein